MVYDQTRMNPRTLMRLWKAWGDEGVRADGGLPLPKHTLKIAAADCLWPGAIYRARELGYMRAASPGMYRPTVKMLNEILRVLEIREGQMEEAV